MCPVTSFYRRDMNNVSIPTTILGVRGFHCIGDEEHYCVDRHGYLALHNLLLDEKFHAKSIYECEGLTTFHKMRIRYNLDLDNGGLYDGIGTNEKGCKAEGVVS